MVILKSSLEDRKDISLPLNASLGSCTKSFSFMADGGLLTTLLPVPISLGRFSFTASSSRRNFSSSSSSSSCSSDEMGVVAVPSHTSLPLDERSAESGPRLRRTRFLTSGSFDRISGKSACPPFRPSCPRFPFPQKKCPVWLCLEHLG